ncbi:MAG: thymidylate synthase [Bacillota bacterium]
MSRLDKGQNSEQGPVVINAFDLPDAWFQLLYKIFDHGQIYTVERGSFAGSRRLEFDFIALRVQNPKVRPLVPDIPPDISVPAPSDPEYTVEYFARYLMSTERAENEQYTYGERIVPGVEKVLEMYRRDGFGTNQACIEVARPEDIDLDDPPCLRLVDTRIRNGRLNFYVYFRSWDLWGGLPTNLAGLQLVKEYMADELGVEDGIITACSKGLHLYEYAWEWAKQRIRKKVGTEEG